MCSPELTLAIQLTSGFTSVINVEFAMVTHPMTFCSTSRNLLRSSLSKGRHPYLRGTFLQHHRPDENMKLFGSKAFSVFLLSNAVTSIAFRPVSFGKQVQHQQKNNLQQCGWGDQNCLAARGGSTLSSATTTVLNSAVVSDDTTAPVEIFRKDYEPLPHVVSKINMLFSIEEGKTIVTSELFIEPNKSYNGESRDLTLDGDETCVKLLALSLNGKDLEEGPDYTLSPGKLILKNPPAGALLKTVVEIVPEDNTQLSGLYKDGQMYCTQVSPVLKVIQSSNSSNLNHVLFIDESVRSNGIPQNHLLPRSSR